MTRPGLLCGPALAVSAALIFAGLGGRGGWLLESHSLAAAPPSLFAAPVPHRLPRMIVPGPFSPERDEACDPPADAGEATIRDVHTCYAGPENTAAQPRDANLAAMAVSRP